MPRTWHLTLCAALTFATGWVSAANAQGGRAWVDPPADMAAPVPGTGQDDQTGAIPPTAAPPRAREAMPERPVPAKPPAPQAASRGGEEIAASRASLSRQLAVDYLAIWSGSNRAAIEATPDLYAPRVVFHGRVLTPDSLIAEKRRFMRRWPERDYRPQPGSMKVDCDPAGQACTVRSEFEYTAENPARGRRTRGTGLLELVVMFPEGRPVIASETSLVHRGSAAAERDDGPAEPHP